ncbi:putative receptor-like serine/threonine-protein kinase [Drosera capensis]
MKFIKTGSWKRLFSIQRRHTAGKGEGEEEVVEIGNMKYVRTGSLKWLFPIQWRPSSEKGEVEGDVEVPATTAASDTKRSAEKCGDEKMKNGGQEKFQRPTWKCFSFEEIFLATNGFSSDNLVGKGGYAEVYRGKLGNGGLVAVKKLTRSSSEEKREREFLTEIGTIGHVNHPNVSTLIGCCIDNGLILIFHYSSRGSVASRLHDGELPALEWDKRYKIAIGTARGLHYLHKGCQRRIIHRDIKASNILLSEDYEPQISDFGLAKWLPAHWTHHSVLPIEGTVGYLAPEYFSHGIVDEKTDVFAFGVFLLELISGKKPVDASYQSLRNWAKPYLKGGEFEKLADPRLEGTYNSNEFKLLAFAASICIRASSTWRPTMGQVLEIMEVGEIDRERWEVPEKEEKQDELWDLADLESEDDSDSFSSCLTNSTQSS